MIKMKDINFGWPLLNGLACVAMAVGSLFVLLKSIVQGNFSVNMMLGTLLIAGILGLIGWVFIKIAYANKEADQQPH